MKKHYLISWSVPEGYDEDHFWSNKIFVGYFTDKELMNFCEYLHRVSVTYLGDSEPVETTNEQPEKYDLKECFENQTEEIKDKYGYIHKHFTPLSTHISKERVQMLFCGLELILKSDGTYFITDTTGG